MTDFVISEELLNGRNEVLSKTGRKIYEKKLRSRPLSAELQKERERVLGEISQSLTTCSFYDEMISAEGGCYGTRNGERNCDGCSYFEIDGNQLKSTVESLRGNP